MPEQRTPETATTAADENQPAADPAAFWRDLAQDALANPLSPQELAPAAADVLSHLASSPAYLGEMAQLAGRQVLRSLTADHTRLSGAEDHRFADPAWQTPPFDLFARNFLLAEQWLSHFILHAPGVDPKHARRAVFAAQQWFDAFSPSNFPWSNPEVLRATLNQGGFNFLHGLDHFAHDMRRMFDPQAPDGENAFVVGRDVAVTPGKVVLRNELMELIQYAPAQSGNGSRTRPEPLLIVPAWIMKYYILDLKPQDSLIRYLIGRGFTVFCISWRNPGRELAETSFDDYRRLGPMAALDAIGAICGPRRVHALGYCLGGTLLAIAAAAMARDKDDRLASICLLAAQTDFSEPGELQLFIDGPELDALDKIMARQGYLDSRQMAGAFSMLHARDLVWSRMVTLYLLGEEEHPNDLMAWNADATRMPYRMHSHYLRALFLHNDLAEGRFEAGGGRVDIAAIATPIFAVGTASDHVAPWRSVFKIHRLNPDEITFLLASGGHNGGIVSPPGRLHRSYSIAFRPRGGPAPRPQDFVAQSTQKPGSWWPEYADWLAARSGPFAAPPPMGEALCEAPGTYVLQR
ncbi:alpha/beta fold hydrolase [uncultured Rhodoblastus sp.]|uniref:PHA/PHB synthase family protein n=1 Tax=uncultured Rhodoblastus sp. TaxID=543037 RepID=UPI0025ED7C24|nr:alpha/beta fold hydrolase [uncultured Rhodoblastus sp.]